MDFAENDDQRAFLAVLDQMADHAAGWIEAEGWSRYRWNAVLDDLLETQGFYDAATEETLGPLAASAMIMRLSRLSGLVECAASSLLRPLLGCHIPRPIAVVRGRGAVRFLPVARSVVRFDDDQIFVANLPSSPKAAPSQYAYPMAALPDGLDWSACDIDADAVWNRWRVAVAAELTGVLQGGLSSVIEHVSERRQFGRPIGSFQGIQQRLATASAAIEAANWLVLRASWSGAPQDAQAALSHVQAASTGIVYDFHQFMGAMGITLEHPLHRWTYRARLLRSEFGGAAAEFDSLAVAKWGAA